MASKLRKRNIYWQATGETIHGYRITAAPTSEGIELSCSGPIVMKRKAWREFAEMVSELLEQC